jgi:hypothetical protein
MLIGKTYMLDKSTDTIHDLSRCKAAGCEKDIKAVKYKHRKYLKFTEALWMVADEKAYGCASCLPGMSKKA